MIEEKNSTKKRRNLADGPAGMKKQARLDLPSPEDNSVFALNQMGIQFSQNRDFTSSALYFESALQVTTVLEHSQEHTRVAFIYDEGLFIHTKPISFPVDINDHSLRSIIILFNLGQACLQSSKISDAAHWYKLALTKSRSESIEPCFCVKINHNLGYCYYLLGKSDEAKQYFETAYQLVRSNELGELYDAATKNALAVINFHNAFEDNSGQIYQDFQVVLKVFMKQFGIFSKQVAAIQNNLGRLFHKQGELKLALEAYKQALFIRRQLLGEEAVDVAATLCNIGQALHRMGDGQEALNYYNQFLRHVSSFSDFNHLDSGVVLMRMGDIYQDNGKYEEATDHFKRALFTIQRFAWGDTRAEQIILMNKLGFAAYHMDRLDEALDFFCAGLHLERSVFQGPHKHTATTTLNIAKVHQKQKNFALAVLYYRQAYDIQVTEFGTNSRTVADTLSCVALMEYLQSHFSEALDLYQQVLQIQRDLDEESIAVSDTLSSIGRVLFHLGSPLQTAISCFAESLRIRKKLLGPNHRDNLTVMYNLATACAQAGDEDTAIRLHLEALQSEQNPEDVIITLKHLGILYQRKCDYENSIQYYKAALKTEESKADKSICALANLWNLIGSLFLHMGDVEETMKCYTIATRLYQQNDSTQQVVIAGYNLYTLQKILDPNCAAAA